MSEKVLQLSEEGFDPQSAAVKNLIIDSDYTHPKIVLGNDPEHFKYESYTFASEPPNNSTTTLFSIPHGYTYVPAGIVQMIIPDYGDLVTNLPFYQIDYTFLPPSGFGAYEHTFYYETTATHLLIKLKRTLTAGHTRPPLDDLNGSTWNFKWLIFAESGLS